MASEEHIGDPDFEDSDFDEELEEIDDEEREALRQDLLDVRTLKAVLHSKGVRGIVVYCPDCENDHYLGWDLLANNLQEILQSGKPRVHEPAWNPDPDEYVSWDYARGFLDGYESEPAERAGEQICAYCGSHLPDGGYEWTYCPSCGKDLAPVNLMRALRDMGWDADRIAELMEKTGFDPPLFDIDGLDFTSPPEE